MPLARERKGERGREAEREREIKEGGIECYVYGRRSVCINFI